MRPHVHQMMRDSGLIQHDPSGLIAPLGLAQLNERTRDIFRQIVESYLATGEPVGSRNISRLITVPLSPASVRNVMSDLEHLGLIYAPHTSAGRLPTELGLRFFVDALMQVGDLTEPERQSIEAQLASVGRAQSVEAAIEGQIAAPRDAAKTIADVTSMRALMLRERPPRHAFDLKLADGGLVDLEFIAQSAQLLIGKSLGVPQAPTAVVLERLGANGVLAEGARLAEIHGVYSAVLQVVSAALLHPFRDEEWTAPFKELLARLTHYPSFSRLADDLAAMRDEVGAAAAKWYGQAGEGRGP